MNAEHLLDAMGLLDDDLVREAEQYSPSKPKIHYKTWLSWAACFAVVLVLGYGITYLKSSGGTGFHQFTNGAASMPSASDSLGEAPPQSGENAELEGADKPILTEPTAPGASGDGSSGAGEEALVISVWLDEPVNGRPHSVFHWYGEDQTLDELPEGCVSLGELERLPEREEANVPYTDREEYIGCQAWLLQEDPNRLYVELPEGGYLEYRRR